MELRCEQLTMQFSGKTALDGFSATLNSGGLIGLIGPNGAGKTTLMKVLATLLKPTGGDAKLDGVSIVKKPGQMRSVLGYLPQQVPVYQNLSAKEFLKYMAAAKGLPAGPAEKQIDALLEQLHLGDVGKKPLGGFSGGMRQRVGIAATLLGNPKIIIADEPTTGLDPMERVSLRNLLSELATERIVLLSTHIVSDVEAVASSLLLLKKGRLLYQGGPGGVMEMAAGRVWEYTLPTGQMPPAGTAVSSLVQTAQGVHVRAVAHAAPVAGAVQVEARLEDACLAVLEGGVSA